MPTDDKCIINPERDCIGKAEAAKLEGRIKALEEWKDDSKRFHEDFYREQKERAKRDGQIDEQLITMSKDMSEVKADVKLVLETQKACAAKTGGRWASIKDKVIVGVATSVVTAIVLALLVLAAGRL